MTRWWDCSRQWAWIAYESARMRGEKVAFGMRNAFFVATSGHFNGRRSCTGPMVNELRGDS